MPAADELVAPPIEDCFVSSLISQSVKQLLFSAAAWSISRDY
jgi:hypothetical protein